MPAAINIILADPIKLVEDDIISQIAGNAPREIKEIPLKWLALFRSRKNSFANPITSRVKIVEVSVIQNPEDQQRTEGRVVCEIDVTEGKNASESWKYTAWRLKLPDMLSRSGVMDEGCAVLLIDEYGLPTCYLLVFKWYWSCIVRSSKHYRCSVCSLATLCAIEGRDTRPGVSQAINTVFHHPAQLLEFSAFFVWLRLTGILGVQSSGSSTPVWLEEEKCRRVEARYLSSFINVAKKKRFSLPSLLWRYGILSNIDWWLRAYNYRWCLQSPCAGFHHCDDTNGRDHTLFGNMYWRGPPLLNIMYAP